MALKDCLRKMEKAGTPVSEADTVLLEQWIDQGLTDDDVLQRYGLHIEKKLFDITKAAQDKGAPVSVKRDVLAEVRSFSEAVLVKARIRLVEVRNEYDELNNQFGEISFVESEIKNWELGGPSIDLADNGILLVRFRQMLFRPGMREVFAAGEFAGGLIKGNDAYELLDSFRAMQERGKQIVKEMSDLFHQEVDLINQIDSLTEGRGIQLDPDTGEYLMGPLPPSKPEGVSEESWSYTFSTGPQAPAKKPFTIKTGKGAEGDLYLQRVGPNAGTVHRTRQGPSDMAISLDQDVLLPDYMYYFLTYLQPQLLARAHGTAQQAINKRDVEEVITKAFQNMVREDAGTFYTDSGATPAERLTEAAANYKAVVKVVEERTIATGITTVKTAHDAAHVLAAIRKEASEGFYALVLDKDNKVVGVVEHTRGGVGVSSVFPSALAGAVHTIPGAAKVWWAHNHPSGVLTASGSDKKITAKMGNLLEGSDIQVLGHVIMAAGEKKFTLLDEKGETVSMHQQITPAPRRKRVKVLTRRLLPAKKGPALTKPEDTLQAISDMGNPEGVLMLDHKNRIVGFLAMLPEEMMVLRGTGQGSRIMRAFAEMNVSAFIVSTKEKNDHAANNMGAFADASDWRMLDAMYLEGGQTVSGKMQGQIFGQTEFYQLAPGLHSGLMVAALTMPRTKGTLKDMMDLLKKQPGVSRVQKPQVDEDGDPIYEKGKPSKKLRVKVGAATFTVLQNPTEEQTRAFRQSIRMERKERGVDRGDDPLTRSTYDPDGNEWLWASDDTIHTSMEDALSPLLGLPVNNQVDGLSQQHKGMTGKRKQVIETTYPEMDFLQIEEFFEARGGPVTQEEIIAYIRKNGIVVEETFYGGPIIERPILTVSEVLVDEVYDRYDLPYGDPEGTIVFNALDDNTQRDYDILYDPQTGLASATPDGGETWLTVDAPGPGNLRLAGQDQQEAAISMAQKAIKQDIMDRERGSYAGPAQWANSRQTLPGGKFDRELVLRTPKVPSGGVLHGGDLRKMGGSALWSDNAVDALTNAVDKNPNVGNVQISRFTMPDGKILNVRFEGLLPENYDDFAVMMSNMNLRMENEENNLEEIRAKLDAGEMDEIGSRQVENYEGGYWDQSNIFAHIRMTDRIGPNGERILFIEEIQSTIHQRGSRVGYREPIPAVPKYTLKDTGRHYVVLGEDGQPLRYNGKIVQEAPLDQRGYRNETEARALVDKKLEATRVVLAQRQSIKEVQLPFKGNAWIAVAIKRLIRLAAEEGYDQLGFITGELQAVRNRQATEVSEITWNPRNGILQIWDQAGQLSTDTVVDKYDLWRHMSEERVEQLKEQAKDQEARYAVEPARDVLDGSYVSEQYGWADASEMKLFSEDLGKLAEDGELYTATDNNGDFIRNQWGDIVVARTEEEMQDYVARETFPDEGISLPNIMGLTDFNVTERGAGNIKFYNSTTPNIARKVARKMDKQTDVRLKATEIHTRDGAPFTIEIQKTFRTGSLPLLEWVVMDDQGKKHSGPYASEERAAAARHRLNEFTATIHIMDITEDLATASMEGTTHYQKKKGAISFDEARRGVIRLTESRDLSTFMHEAGHLYLEIMGGLAEDANTPQQIKDDYAKILEYLGVSSREEIGTKEHEKWAKSFEKYLQEGRAPSVALQSAFNAYRRWLSDIWKRMKGDSPDGIILTPEIRDVMDRILASDEQIAVANATQEFAAVFSTAEQMGVSQRVFDVYKNDILKATNEAVEKETQRLMAAANRDQKKWWRDELNKVRATVEKEAWEMKVYQAFALLAHGTQPNGESLEQGSPFKLDKESLLELLQGSKTTLKRLPKPWVYTVKNGVDVDVAAKILGYRDGMELVTALMEMPNMKDWINQTAEDRLALLFPDPMLDGSVSETAIKAVHNEARANVLITEMRRLRALMRDDAAIVGATKRDIRDQATMARLANRGMLPKRDELKVIKQFAAATMGAMKIMDVRPEVYLNAERKAGRLAFEAAARGDHQNAYNFKRQQIVNHEMYRAAVRAKDQATGWRNYLAKFSKPRVIQRLGKLGVIEPILAVIEGIQLKKVTLKSINRKTALQMLAQQIHDGEIVTPIAEHLYKVEVDDKGNETVVLLEQPFKNWQELTVDELHAMRDIVKQLEHQASKKLEMPVNGVMVVMDEAITELTEQVEEVNEEVDIGIGTKGLVKQVEEGWTSGISHWLGPSVMAKILDKQGWGAMTRLVIVTIRRAITEKMIPMQKKALRDVNELYLKFYTSGPLGINDRALRQLEKDKNFATINGEKLSRGDVISIGLNMGNEGNKSALFNGIKINDTVAYPEDQVMAALAKLDANDWHFIQAVWDYFDSYWPALSEMERQRRGISPEKVEHVPFTVQTADGQTVNMKGGYMPLSYNYEHSERHEERQFEDHYKSMRNSSFLAASTRAGATHNRVKNHNMVVQLGLFQIEKKLKEITRDISIGGEVNFTSNLLQDKGFRRAMKRTGNAKTLRQLELWLTDAAVGELPANNVIERRMAWLRVGFTISKIALNVYTTALQLTGIFQSMASLGSQAMLMGAGRVMKNPWTAWTEARDASAFMRARYGWQDQAFDRDVHDAAGILSEYGTGLPTVRRRLRGGAARLFFLPIAKMQQVVDVITWHGAYWKGRNKEGLGDQEAVYFADAEVELAQTSGLFSDRSGIERGTLSATTRQQQFIRLWTALISYMQRKGGIAYMKTQALKEDMGIITATMYAIDMLLLFTVEGVVSAILYDRWDWDEDDPVELLKAAAIETGWSVAAGVPFVREIQSAIYGSGNTPIGALGNDLVTLYIQGMQGEMDPALRKAFVNSAGTLLHLPASQTNRLLEALIDESDPELLEYFTGTRD